MDSRIAAKIRQVTPYTPGEQPHEENIVKLNTNENPYPPSKKVCEAIKELTGNTERLRLYPDPDSAPLKEALVEHFNRINNGVKYDTKNFFVGVGSDDVLGTAFHTFFNCEEPVLFPDITYSFYEVWCDLFEITTMQKPLDKDMRLVKAHYTDKTEYGGIVIANPNAPTGLSEPLSFIKEVCKAHPECVVIVDEAYVDFGGESAAGLIEELPNLLVVQTFSKSRSLAGLRIGYAIGNKELIKAMEDVRYSYNSYTMNLPAQLLGSAVLSDEDYFKETVGKIVNERERSKERLASRGFHFPDSKTNFIFAEHESVSGEKIFTELKKRGIYVRHFSGENIKNFNRITIGTPAQMDRLFSALDEILKE